MKSRRAATVKTLIVLSSVLFVLTVLMSNSKNYPVSSASIPAFMAKKGGGADIYAESCVRCHGADGRAQTSKGKRVGATDFTSPNWKPNNARGIRAITNGKGDMPAFKDTLNAEQINSVWNYVRKFQK